MLTLLLLLVSGLYSVYLLQQAAVSLGWQTTLILSRNQLDLQLDNALNCFALYYPDSSECQTEPSLTFDSRVASANQIELSVGLGRAMASQAIRLGGGLAGEPVVNSEQAIESVFGRSVDELVSVVDAQITTLEPTDCADQILAQLELGAQSMQVFGDCEILAAGWQSITSLQLEVVMFRGGRVWIEGSNSLHGTLVIDASQTSPDWEGFSISSGEVLGEDVIVLNGIAVTGGLVLQGQAQLFGVSSSVDPLVSSSVLAQFGHREWQAWSWDDE